MNEPLSSSMRGDDDGSGSPKRKKVRAKYAPKACVACRRSKLKCSGENPCHRCVDNGRRCFYSEDQTAAEALQNLSRPTPVLPSLAANGTGNGIGNGTGTGNGNGTGNGTSNSFLRRSILPRHEVIERRASDASVLGISMEARMARIEGMMETLIRDGSGMGATPRGSIERDDTVSEGFAADTTPFGTSIEPSGASATPGRQLHQQLPQLQQPVRPQQRLQQQSGYQPIETAAQHCISTPSPPTNVGNASSIQVGSRSLVFPDASDYNKYIDFFFVDVNGTHPCINEIDFRLCSGKIDPSRPIHPNDVCFLALNYIIFAVVDILTDTTNTELDNRPAGWQWFQIVEELIGKRKLFGRGDVRLLQTVAWQAIYLENADQPNAAYNTIGLASKLCFRFGFHQQTLWSNCTPFESHMRQRLFWTIYALDRRISLSCGRPYTIRDCDVDVNQPLYVYDKHLHPDRPMPRQDFSGSSIDTLRCMVGWAKLAGDVWDQLFSPPAIKRGIDPETVAILDARISHFTTVNLPPLPLISIDNSAEARQERQHAWAHNHFAHLRLLLYRRTMLSLQYDATTGHLCADLARHVFERIQPPPKNPDSFRSQVAISLGHSILIFSALLLHDPPLPELELNSRLYADNFLEACSLLEQISEHHLMARRIYSDLLDIIVIARKILNHRGAEPLPVLPNLTDLFPWQVLDPEQQFANSVQRNERLDHASEDWEAEFGHSVQGYGVMWL